MYIVVNTKPIVWNRTRKQPSSVEPMPLLQTKRANTWYMRSMGILHTLVPYRKGLCISRCVTYIMAHNTPLWQTFIPKGDTQINMLAYIYYSKDLYTQLTQNLNVPCSQQQQANLHNARSRSPLLDLHQPSLPSRPPTKPTKHS